MSLTIGSAQPAGSLSLQVVRRPPTDREMTFGEIRRYGFPTRHATDEVNAWRAANVPNLLRGLRRVAAARALRLPHFYGSLFLQVHHGGRVVDLGLASLRVVTATGVKYLTDDIAGGANDSNLFKFHGFGTGTAAEAATDTALGTELTTQYNPDNTRPTGSQASAASGNNATYTTVATLSPDSGGTIAITEHGIFTATSAGTLLDRSVFSAVNLVAGSDSLQATYVLTINSGG